MKFLLVTFAFLTRYFFMAKFVPDVKTQRWIVLSPVRAFRPRQAREAEGPFDVVIKNGKNFRPDCPFCFGNEIMTPPEVYRWGKKSPNDGDWLVRVVPNKYPITDLHEVIIHSPDHKGDIDNLPLANVEILFKVYRERFKALSLLGTVLIFNNKGWASGESLLHPHSQAVVLPKQIKLDVLALEPVRNIVLENEYFIVYCPDFSQWPYEVWIAPKKCVTGESKESCCFGDSNDKEISHLALIMQKIIKKLLAKFSDLSYNYYIYPYSPWYIRIIPRLTERAGFELGTGLNVNVVDPSAAAEELRNGKE